LDLTDPWNWRVLRPGAVRVTWSYQGAEATVSSTAVEGPLEPFDLRVRSTGPGSVEISWPDVAQEAVLEEAADPAGPWQPVLGSPTRVGGETRFETILLDRTRFFRLHPY
jgi:hypothetical protein